MIGSDFFVCIILVVVGLFIGIGILCAIRNEKKGFNDGICPICGEKLKHFDNDSQGGRGYCCPSTKHRYYTWVSYKFIDKNFGKKNSKL